MSRIQYLQVLGLLPGCLQQGVSEARLRTDSWGGLFQGLLPRNKTDKTEPVWLFQLNTVSCDYTRRLCSQRLPHAFILLSRVLHMHFQFQSFVLNLDYNILLGYNSAFVPFSHLELKKNSHTWSSRKHGQLLWKQPACFTRILAHSEWIQTNPWCIQKSQS